MASKRKDFQFQMTNLPYHVNVVVFVLLFLLVGWGCLLNIHGHKYSKIYPAPEQLPTPYKYCHKRMVVALDIPDSYTCCDSARSGDLLCLSSFDPKVKLLSSNWAWLLPFVPLVCTTLIELISEFLHPLGFNSMTKREGREHSTPLGALQEGKGKFVSVLMRSIMRAVVYFLIILIRVVRE
jgi:hypothetical protein